MNASFVLPNEDAAPLQWASSFFFFFRFVCLSFYQFVRSSTNSFWWLCTSATEGKGFSKGSGTFSLAKLSFLYPFHFLSIFHSTYISHFILVDDICLSHFPNCWGQMVKPEQRVQCNRKGQIHLIWGTFGYRETLKNSFRTNTGKSKKNVKWNCVHELLLQPADGRITQSREMKKKKKRIMWSATGCGWLNINPNLVSNPDIQFFLPAKEKQSCSCTHCSIAAHIFTEMYLETKAAKAATLVLS